MAIQEGDIIKMQVAGIAVVALIIETMREGQSHLSAKVITPARHYGIVLWYPKDSLIIDAI